MPAAALARLPPASAAARSGERDDIVHLHDASWEDYLRILAIRGEHAVPRIAYREGTIEIMSPSRSHERINTFIARLVEVYCLDRNIEMTPVGNWTLNRKSLERGVEPDECYIFGADAPRRNRPDLAIEVEWSHGGIDKLEIYAPLGIREVWRWADGKLHVHVLRGKRYVRASKSHVLPDLDLRLLMRFVDRPTLTRAVRDFRAALSRRRP